VARKIATHENNVSEEIHQVMLDRATAAVILALCMPVIVVAGTQMQTLIVVLE